MCESSMRFENILKMSISILKLKIFGESNEYLKFIKSKKNICLDQTNFASKRILLGE